VKVAIIHDWLTGMRGGEKCLEIFCEIFPDADLFTLVHVPGSVSPTIERHRIVTSMIQRLPAAKSRYRYYLPLMPTAIEALDLTGYDLLLSSSHCVAKGALGRPDALHVSYVHTPMRYAWDLWPQYFPPGGRLPRWLVAPVLNYLRTWDVASSGRVDRYLANSRFVARRIEKYYRRDASVVPPPVNTEFFSIERRDADYYLIVSALVPYKGVELAIRTFNALGRPLKIVGDGPLRKSLESLAGPNIELTGWVSDAALRDYYAGCRALLLPALEDFGIVPLEANAAGRPVITLGRGGPLDSVVPLGNVDELPPTGVFFDELDPDSLSEAVLRFERHEAEFEPEALRRHARRFDREAFRRRMESILEECIAAWRETRRSGDRPRVGEEVSRAQGA